VRHASWARAWALFCLATVLFLVYRDVFVASARDVEVFFGLELRGEAARWTAPLHWALFALGGIGFWRGWPRIAPTAAAYAFYVAFSHLVWNSTSPSGGGLGAGLVQALLFSLPGIALLWRPPIRSGDPESGGE
jgi:hypothetical protein